MGDGKSDLYDRDEVADMIIGRKSLEKRIDTVGRKAIELSYETLTNLSYLNVNFYNEVLTAGYKALSHRKKRLLQHYEIQKNPWFLDKLYVRNVERYVSKMMSVKAESFFSRPPPIRIKKKYFVF